MEIAAHFGLSRSVTREAIKMLVAMGRISAQRGRVLFVGADTPSHQKSLLAGHQFVPGRMEHVDQLLRFRSVQEEFAAREAAEKATPRDLKVLDQAIADGREAALVGDIKAWDDSDSRFHLGIAKASGNLFVCSALETVRQLQGQVGVLALHGGAAGSLDQAQRDHEDILAAIRSGDPELAATRANAHLRHTIDGYRGEIEHLLATARA